MLVNKAASCVVLLRHFRDAAMRRSSAAPDAEDSAHVDSGAPGTNRARLPAVFLCPVITASPLTGCNQVVLFASSLLVRNEQKKSENRIQWPALNNSRQMHPRLVSS